MFAAFRDIRQVLRCAQVEAEMLAQGSNDCDLVEAHAGKVHSDCWPTLNDRSASSSHAADAKRSAPGRSGSSSRWKTGYSGSTTALLAV